jgi:hypothetical protein
MNRRTPKSAKLELRRLACCAVDYIGNVRTADANAVASFQDCFFVAA